MGNLVMYSPVLFANSTQMVGKASGLLLRELVYLTHGNALDIGGMDAIGKESMRMMLGKVADQATTFALLRYSEKYKVAGVSQNFAKAASWVWMAVLMGALFACQFGMKWLCRDCFTSYGQNAREVICQVLDVGAVWCPLTIVTCVGLAARGLKRHPGLQGPR